VGAHLLDHRPPIAEGVADRVPRLLKKGVAYQLEAPTLWDVDFRTAVAQAELEDREQPGAYHRIRFANPDGRWHVEIETTRPS
jgi:valyl-tRNA synthetase